MLVFLLPLPPLLFVQAYASFACLAQVPHVGVGVEGGTAHCLLYLGRVVKLGQQAQVASVPHCPPPPILSQVLFLLLLVSYVLVSHAAITALLR